MTELLESKIKNLPKEPGVYVMLGSQGEVIYVGKAKNLKNRVSQYFRNAVKTQKVARMVECIEDFYYLLTNTERDALSLENNLIKKHKPKYNVLLKDDKSYPYIRVDLKEEFPRFTVVRKIKKDGAKYFGPYMLNVSVNDVLSIIKNAYKIRPCSKNFNKTQKRECLNYHLGLCLAPCSGKCSKEEYLSSVKNAVSFLSGNDDEAEKLLKEKMMLSAQNEEFERALKLKEQLSMLKRIKERKITALSRLISLDVISVKSDGLFSAISVLFVRNGKSMGIKNYWTQTFSESDEEILSEFLLRFYDNGREVPPEILLQYNQNELIVEKLRSYSGKKTVLSVPEKGVKKELMKMADKNASDYLETYVDKIIRKNEVKKLALFRLRELLGLSKTPNRMECFDISHVSGVDKVGSMVVFTDGEPDKNSYRRFKIKTVEGNDDFACLKEVLLRRLSKLNTPEEDKFKKPDLIVIDGGKGQLSSVKSVFDSLGILDIDLISLAEKQEEIFTLFSKNSIRLERSDQALKMLQRLRDEAHRFAITFNRDLRTKRTLKSLLLEIDGVGKVKRNALIDKFIDISGLIKASEEELSQVEGIGDKLAKKIKEFLNSNGNVTKN